MLSLISSALAGVLVVTSTDIDDGCCGQKVVVAVQALDFVEAIGVDPATDQSCVVLKAAVDEARLRAAFESAGFPIQKIDTAESCPAGTKPRIEPWANVADLDARIVSHGELVPLDPVPGKVTVYDFGAPWCGPCIGVAEALKAALKAESRLAVRVVTLEGNDPKESFAQPVVKQHLEWAEGLPYLIVVDAKGKVLYRGSVVEDALAKAKKALK
jgi:thiol-disulfide isomerase/thioredoxin